MLGIIDDIARIEHIQRRTGGKGTVEIAQSLSRLEGSDDGIYLHLQTMIYQLLIAAKFGSMITTDGMMIVRRIGLEERIVEIQYAEDTLVLKDSFISHGLSEVFLNLLRADIVAIIQVAAIHRPKVG